MRYIVTQDSMALGQKFYDSFNFINIGDYRFNPNELQNAHRASQERALGAVESGKKMIIVDNTNVRRWEMAPYFKVITFHSTLSL